MRAEGDVTVLPSIALVLALASLVLVGAMTGLYFAFSISVMPGFDRIEPRSAIAAMQSINRRIQNPIFFVTFFGTPFLALAAGVLLVLSDLLWPAGFMFASGGVYLLGSLLPTLIVNVPLNLMLDRQEVPADDAAAVRFWLGFSKPWTRWNSIRGAFTALALLLAALAMLRWAG